MKKSLFPFLIIKLIQATDIKAALKNEKAAKILGIVQKSAPSPEQLEPAIGFAVDPPND